MIVNPFDLKPTEALADALKGSVMFAGKNVTIYSAGKRPTKSLPSQFVDLQINGTMTSTIPSMEDAEGYIAISIYSQTKSGVENTALASNIGSQVFELINDKVIGGYYFAIDISNPIYSGNYLANGYSTRVLNCQWSRVAGDNRTE